MQRPSLQPPLKEKKEKKGEKNREARKVGNVPKTYDEDKTKGGERSVLNGDGISEPNLRENPGGPPRINERNYNTESEYEYGSRVGFWRLFRLFEKHDMKFTLYAVAQAVEQQPEVATRCVEAGHDVASQ
jgi:peptidoglycan/xylan/chitin deacetylase (PgdA/CDA1 family)